MKKRKWMKRVVVSAVVLFCMIAVSMMVCDRVVVHAAKDRLFDAVEEAPHSKVGLVLGLTVTSRLQLHSEV